MEELNFDDIFGDLENANARYFEEDRIRAENVANTGNFVRGVKSGTDSMQGSIYGMVGLLGDAAGLDSVRDFGFEGYQRNQEEASLNPIDVQNFTDIETVSDAGKWFAGTLGQLAPSVAEGLVTTLIGAGVGTATAPGVGTAGGALAGLTGRKIVLKAIDEAVESKIKSGIAREVAEREVKEEIIKRATVGGNIGLVEGTAAVEGGGMWGEDAEKHGVDDANPWSAFALGQVSGLSEAYSPGGMLIKRIAGVKEAGSAAADKVADTFLKRLGPEIPKSMSGEAAQEVFQSFLGVLNEKVNDPTVSLTDRDAIYKYINAGAAGAAGGLVFGGVNAAFPEQPANTPPPPPPPAQHTVDDVLNEKAADDAVVTATAKQQIIEAAPLQAPPATIDTILGGDGAAPVEAPPAGPAQVAAIPPAQPDATDIARLDPVLRQMATSLYPDKAKGEALPDWVKIKTLKEWEKGTGEPVKSYVSSTSARETLKAIFDGKPLDARLQKVWGYLKGVAERQATPAAAENVPFDATPKKTNTPPRVTVGDGGWVNDNAQVARDLADNLGLTTEIEDLFAEGKTVDQVTTALDKTGKLTMPHEEKKGFVVGVRATLGIPSQMGAEGKADFAEWQKGYNARKLPPAIQDDPFTNDEAQDANAGRFQAMVQSLNGQETVEDVDAIFNDMAPVFARMPGMEKYSGQWQEARDQAVARIGGGATAQKDITDTQHIPNAERHEVIDNVDSVAHTQELNTAPSEAQKAAGNYKKAHVRLDGMDISIENPSGTTRSGTDANGRAWQTEMKADYGYIKGSRGYDKDHVDVFIKPGYQGGAADVFVVDQHKADGTFDEHKAIVGVASEEEAMEVYKSNYEAGWEGGKAVTRMTMAEFKDWAKSDAPKRGPVAGGAVLSQQPAAAETKAEKQTASETKAKEPAATVKTGSGVDMEVVTTFDNQDTGMRSVVLRHPETGKYHATLQDVDSGNSVSTTIFDDKDKAVAKAQRDIGVVTEPQTPAKAAETAPAGPAIVEHLTKKGKTIKGIVLKGVDKAKVQEIDKYTFPKDGGLFVREKHIPELEAAGLLPGRAKDAEPRAPQAQAKEQERPTPAPPTPLQQEAAKAKTKATERTPPAQPARAKESSDAKKDGAAPAAEFAGNKVFTADLVAAARKRLAEKRNTLRSGFDPELVNDLLVLGGAYFESGIRDFSAWVKTVIDDIGEEFRPYLRGTYENLRHFPDIDKDGMSSQEDVDAILSGKAPAKKAVERPAGDIQKAVIPATKYGYTDEELASIPVTFSPGFLDGVAPENAKQALDIIDEDLAIYEEIERCLGR